MVNKNLAKFEKWHLMVLPIHKKLNAYSGLQQVTDKQLFNLNFEQHIHRQPQRALAYVDDMKITSPEVAIRTWDELDVQQISHY